MSTAGMTRFDPAGPLPAGTAVLEASAGTGKTHAIAALATRYLAEGLVPAERLAVISFSRIASAELRSRVRDRLRATSLTLTRALAGVSSDEPDETDRLLLAGTREELQARLANLRRAIAGLDAASIMTIHQFCQAMLDELGVLAEQDPQATLAEDLSLTVDQVVEDLFLARYARHLQGPPFDLATARRLARAAVDLPDAPLVPSEGLSERLAERREFAAAVRTELDARKRRMGLYSFDDQLLRLRDALGGDAATTRLARLRSRCAVVLVDEFQDTDPVQWQILRTAFDGHVPLVLIGDPKQSIYAFRGADVHAYTDAVRAAQEKYSLAENHRADAGVVRAVNALFHGVTLGEDIAVPPVTATHRASRLLAPTGSPWSTPVRLRCLPDQEPTRAADARTRIIADLTAQVIGLLNSDVQVASDGPRPVRARDIAILVSTNQRGRQVADALTTAGVPVAFSGADSIFATHAAREWLVLLRALEQPRRAAVRAAIVTDFVGGDLTGLALADDERLTAWAGLLQGWSRVLAAQGVSALFAAVQGDGAPGDGSLAERVLRRPRGERDLTDYRHLAEILHAQHSDGLRGQALVSWLAEAVARGSATSDRIRRLETDRYAVQIMTVHKAKGLQFPVVMLPEASDLWVPDEDGDDCLAFHADGRRVLDVGGRDAPGRAERLRAHAAEQAEDRLRSLYVAVTRAQSHLVLWWARTRANTESSPLHRMLFRRRDLVGPPEAAYPLDTPPGDGHPAGLDWLHEAGIAVEECVPATPARLVNAVERPRGLALAAFDRGVDQLWRRTSYSGLTEAVHARPPLALAGEAIVDDEPPADAVPAAVPGVRSPMTDLPGGAAFGSLVHQVLENLDWHAPAPELADRLLAATTDAFARFPVPGVTPRTLADAMLPSLLTPLGTLTGDRPLAGIPVADRLSELTFEFALGTAASRTTLRDVADLMAAWLPATDPLAGYPAELANPQLAGQVLRGYLTGSIDSVLRIPSPEGPRFVVVDYKTNRLGPAELTLDHYTEPAMVAEMVRTHYPLQAILYCVALHRFLAARLPGYEPERHLGGVGYLFVRGMGGPAAPDTGVFRWFPPAGLVTGLSDLLADRGRR